MERYWVAVRTYYLEDLTCEFYTEKVDILNGVREEVRSVEFTVHIISFVLLKSVLSRVCLINKNLPLVFFPVVCNIWWVYFIHIMHFWCLVIFKMSFKEGQLLECGTCFLWLYEKFPLSETSNRTCNNLYWFIFCQDMNFFK